MDKPIRENPFATTLRVAPSVVDAEARAAARRERQRKARRDRDAIRRSLGLVRVRGNLGGIYWE